MKKEYTNQEKLTYWRKKIEYAAKRIEQLEQQIWNEGRQLRLETITPKELSECIHQLQKEMKKKARK